MQHEIKGTTMPVLEFRLDPGDMIVAESGEFSWLSAGIDLKSSLGGGSSQGSLLGAVKRKFAGGSLFMTEYTAREAGELAFATKVPGHIVGVTVDTQYEYRIHTHGFLCATEGVSLQLAFQQKFSAGLFGGEGFRLQKLVGQRTAFVELFGELVEREPCNHTVSPDGVGSAQSCGFTNRGPPTCLTDGFGYLVVPGSIAAAICLCVDTRYCECGEFPHPLTRYQSESSIWAASSFCIGLRNRKPCGLMQAGARAERSAR